MTIKFNENFYNPEAIKRSVTSYKKLAGFNIGGKGTLDYLFGKLENGVIKGVFKKWLLPRKS